MDGVRPWTNATGLACPVSRNLCRCCGRSAGKWRCASSSARTVAATYQKLGIFSGRIPTRCSRRYPYVERHGRHGWSGSNWRPCHRMQSRWLRHVSRNTGPMSRHEVLCSVMPCYAGSGRVWWSVRRMGKIVPSSGKDSARSRICPIKVRPARREGTVAGRTLKSWQMAR